MRGRCGKIGAVTDTYTCASCGETFEKGWSDEEAAAEAEELFPGIDPSDPDEAGVVCGPCFQHIMGRVQAEAPELIGEGWRGESLFRDPFASVAARSDPGPFGSCYQTASGMMVHVRPGCRCKA